MSTTPLFAQCHVYTADKKENRADDVRGISAAPVDVYVMGNV